MDSFGGSHLEIDFAAAVQPPAPDDTTPLTFGRAPAGTHFAFYAVTYRDELDADGNPIGRTAHAFQVQDFEIQPAIDPSSPCFIESEESRFPGLHVTRFAAKLREQTGIVEPLDPPEGTPEEDVIDVLTADRRMGLLPRIEEQIKAVTSQSPYEYPEAATTCVEDDPGVDPNLIPPPDCIGESSNRARLALCQQIWAENPDKYEGNDKVFSLPLNGGFRGVVVGQNPVNNAPIGGASFFVDINLADIDELHVNWQYDDADGDGFPDYPADLPDADKSAIGFHYMSGTPIDETRGVKNVPMTHRFFRNVAAEAAIFADLDDDDVHF